ncbi:hypothetical protein AGMMS49949_04040 [Alphaproteobacteria bacterium]|nr:hypothetical protein AGMMS49949_04040 [Alphaproteobacteria bacterium]GHS96352.1 hypothetical protein AGMMS50296_2410 [Alphaproteobacteria bacterium]
MKDFVAKALLFDQLTAESAWAPREKNTPILLTKEQLLASVQSEISDIFNTRSSFTSEQIQDLLNKVRHETALSGIPGFMGLPPMQNVFVEDSSRWSTFEDLCEMMIRLYEPRLAEPSVSVRNFDPLQQNLNITISGVLKSGALRENVSFPLNIAAGENVPET